MNNIQAQMLVDNSVDKFRSRNEYERRETNFPKSIYEVLMQPVDKYKIIFILEEKIRAITGFCLHFPSNLLIF